MFSPASIPKNQIFNKMFHYSFQQLNLSFYWNVFVSYRVNIVVREGGAEVSLPPPLPTA